MLFNIIYNYLTMCLLMFKVVYVSLVVRAQVGPHLFSFLPKTENK